MTRGPPWSDEENQLLAVVYPEEGLSGTVKAFTTQGFARTRAAIKGQVYFLGLRVSEKYKTRQIVQPTSCPLCCCTVQLSPIDLSH